MIRTLPRPFMGRGGRGCRPKASDGDAGTRQIRVNDDLAEMISLIVRVLGGSSAQLVDPWIRPEVMAIYEKHRTAIEPIREAERKVREAEELLKRTEEDAARQAAAKPRKPKGS